MRERVSNRGFTLVEVLVTAAIIGILVAISIVAYADHLEKARIARVANDLKAFEEAFLDFLLDTGSFPPDSHLNAPYHLANGVGIEKYIPLNSWVSTTPLGGNYNWEGLNNYPYAGISLFATTASIETLTKLDEVIDNGDINTGIFRKTPNNRYTYIITE